MNTEQTDSSWQVQLATMKSKQAPEQRYSNRPPHNTHALLGQPILLTSSLKAFQTLPENFFGRWFNEVLIPDDFSGLLLQKEEKKTEVTFKNLRPSRKKLTKAPDHLPRQEGQDR